MNLMNPDVDYQNTKEYLTELKENAFGSFTFFTPWRKQDHPLDQRGNPILMNLDDNVHPTRLIDLQSNSSANFVTKLR